MITVIKALGAVAAITVAAAAMSTTATADAAAPATRPLVQLIENQHPIHLDHRIYRALPVIPYSPGGEPLCLAKQEHHKLGLVWGKGVRALVRCVDVNGLWQWQMVL